MSITLIGLGLKPGDVTLEGAELIQKAEKVVVKSKNVAPYEFLRSRGIEAETLDELFERTRTFDGLTKKIAAKVYAMSRGVNLVYCTEGSVAEDNAAKLILARHPKTRVVSGVSKAGSVAEKLGINVGYTALSAYDVPDADLPTGALIVYDIDSDVLAGEIKLKLTSHYGDECPTVVFDGDERRDISLYELDRLPSYGYATRAAVLPRPFLQKDAYTFDDLMRLLSMLRGENGCPWDRAQTHESIRINAIEEVYEMIDAIDRGDDERLLEEVGDVFLQAVFHTEMAEDRGAFDRADVFTGICKKLIGRHTHIFFGDSAADANEALDVWEKNKVKEHNQTPKQAVADVPKALPALMRAQKLQKRAVKAGIVDDTAEDTAGRIKALADDVARGEKGAKTREIGDLLFECVALARKKGGDAEEILGDRAEEFRRKVCDDDK